LSTDLSVDYLTLSYLLAVVGIMLTKVICV